MSTESKLTLDAFAGLLAPVEAPTPEPAPEAVPAPAEQETSPEEPAADAPIATKSRKPSRAKKQDVAQPKADPAAAVPEAKAATSGGATSSANPYRPVNISLPTSISKRYEAYKSSTGHSHSEILFDAIDETIDRLPDLIRAKYGESKSTSIFNRPNRTTVTFAPEEDSSMFIVRVRKDNVDILEDLWHRLGAPNRNAMIVVAYDEFLPKTTN